MADLAEIGFVAKTDQLEKANDELKKMRPNAEGVQKASDKLNDELVKTDSRLKRVANGTNISSGAFSKMRGIVGGLVGQLVAFTASTLALGSAIVNARSFGAAIAEVTTLMNTSASETALLEKNARSLGIAYGTGATPQVQAFYQAISAGAGDVAAATKLLDQANKLAIGGVTDVTTAVDILTTATNVYGASGLTSAEASDALFVAMKAGKTTITELSASLGKVLPLANNLGVSFDEVAAATAALTKGGINTAEAVTGLRAAMTSVLGPSKQASDLAKDLGINFSASGLEAKGFAGFMAEVVEKTGGSSTAMQTLFGSVEATTVALAMSGEAGGFLTEILADMGVKAGATNEAFEKMSATFDQRINRAMAALADIGLILGNALLSVLVPALEFVVNNIGRFVAIAATAAAGLTVAFLPAIIGVTAGIAKFTAALILNKAALMRTGWGLLVVIIGEIAYQFYNAIKATNSMGDALKLVAATGKAGALELKAWFLQSIQDISSAFIGMTQTLANGINAVFGTSLKGMDYASLGNSGMVESEWSGIAGAAAQADKAAQAAADSLEDLRGTMGTTSEAVDDGSNAADRLAAALAGAPGTSGGGTAGAAGKAKDALKELQDQAKAWDERTRTPLEKYNKELEQLNKLLNTPNSGLGPETYQRAVKQLNEELANSYPLVTELGDAFGNFVVNGFKDFKGFVDSILGSFKSMIAQMISMAVQSRIMQAFGLGGGGTVASAAGSLAQGVAGLAGPAAGAAPGAAATGIGGAFQAAGTAFMTGVSGFTSALFGAGGGLGAAASYVGTALSGATASMAGFATAIGAVALPVAAVVGAFMFFKKKTKELDSGLRVTANASGTLVDEFKKIETSRFFGLSKKESTNYSNVSSTIANPIIQAVNSIRTNVLDLASVLGIGSNALKGFSSQINISLKGLDEQQAQAKIQQAFGNLSNEMAAQALTGIKIVEEIVKYRSGGLFRKSKTWVDNEKQVDASIARQNKALAKLQKPGETASQTLQRLGESLSLVNASFMTLGYNLKNISIAGGVASSKLIDVFGSLDNFSRGMDFYFQNFFTLTERVNTASRQFGEAMNALGLVEIPESVTEFRALVDSLMLEGKTTKAVKLIQLGPFFLELQRLQEEFENAGKSTNEMTEKLTGLMTAQDVFVSRQDQVFAASSEGMRKTIAELGKDEEIKEILEEAVAAIREGNINNARISTKLLAIEEKRDAALSQ